MAGLHFRDAGLADLPAIVAMLADDHRFYERLGFKASHVGYKCDLAQP